MRKIKQAPTDYKQIKKMIKQLKFEKRITLIREIISESGYKKEFYEYTEGLVKKYGFPRMRDEELDKFLHKKN